jgi:hypothetical protein
MRALSRFKRTAENFARAENREICGDFSGAKSKGTLFQEPAFRPLRFPGFRDSTGNYFEECFEAIRLAIKTYASSPYFLAIP